MLRGAYDTHEFFCEVIGKIYKNFIFCPFPPSPTHKH